MKVIVALFAVLALAMPAKDVCQYDTSEKEQFVSCIESMGSGKLKKGLQQAQQSAECDDSTCLVSKLCENEVAAQKLLSNIGQENIMEFVDIAEQCFQ